MQRNADERAVLMDRYLLPPTQQPKSPYLVSENELVATSKYLVPAGAVQPKAPERVLPQYMQSTDDEYKLRQLYNKRKRDAYELIQEMVGSKAEITEADMNSGALLMSMTEAGLKHSVFDPLSREEIEMAAYAVGLKPDKKLTDIQIDAINFIRYKEMVGCGSILALEQGLGKTLVAVTVEAISRITEPGTTLIITPNQVDVNWIKEIQEYYGYNITIMYFDGQDKKWMSYGGGNKQGVEVNHRLNPVNAQAIGMHHIVIAHVDALTSIWRARVRTPVLKKLKELDANALKFAFDKEEAQRKALTKEFPLLDWSNFQRVKANASWVNVRLLPNGGSSGMVGDILGYPYKRIIYDESHKIKNPESQRAEMCHAFPSVKKLALTGTPMYDNLNNMWSQLRFIEAPEVGHNGMTYKDFDAAATEISTMLKPENFENVSAIVKQDTSKKLEELQKRLQLQSKESHYKGYIAKRCLNALAMTERWMFRVTKNDIAETVQTPMEMSEARNKYYGWQLIHYSTGDIPACYMKTVELVPSQALRSIHNAIGAQKRSEYQQLDAKQQSTFLFQAITHLRMLCAHPGCVPEDTYEKYCKDMMDTVQTARTEDQQKLLYIMNYKVEHMQPGDKGLIFIHFVESCHLYANCLTRAGMKTYVMSGELKKHERKDILERFQRDPHAVFLIATDCFSEGLNCVAANVVFFVSPWWNLGRDSQCYSRVHRTGQKKECFVIYLVYSGTADATILSIARKKDGVSSSFSNKDRKKVLGIGW